jgi:predicted type IV restriction endonuclease
MDEARLASHIQSARDLYDRVKGRKSFSEADTKAFFIDPVLRALGWPMDDPRLIHREFPVYDGTRLDYALFDEGAERPAIFVEAKGLVRAWTTAGS